MTGNHVASFPGAVEPWFSSPTISSWILAIPPSYSKKKKKKKKNTSLITEGSHSTDAHSFDIVHVLKMQMMKMADKWQVWPPLRRHVGYEEVPDTFYMTRPFYGLRSPALILLTHIVL